jgi:hypothetical protein
MGHLVQCWNDLVLRWNDSKVDLIDAVCDAQA